MTAQSATWDVFTNSGKPQNPPVPWPEAPPWRDRNPQPKTGKAQKCCWDAAYWNRVEKLKEKKDLLRQRGAVFRLPRTEDNQLTDAAEQVRLAVNAAIHLRRPLLVTGTPGSGKTSLAHAIAWELQLGPVLHWPITPRTRLIEDGLYLYDALGRLHDSQFAATHAKDAAKSSPDDFPVADYITLGPVGTAFLPFERPRLLLIDELDKSDLQLPNELLNLFEEGEFDIPQLIREAKRRAGKGKALSTAVRTHDPGASVVIPDGRVRCSEFPVVVMTSNREREFPAAFHRRCIRVDMPAPTDQAAYQAVVREHFKQQNRGQLADQAIVIDEILEFLESTREQDRATDQLLNALHLLTLPSAKRPTKDQITHLRTVLYRGLRARDLGPDGP
jgi:MoxR-like ATPase